MATTKTTPVHGLSGFTFVHTLCPAGKDSALPTSPSHTPVRQLHSLIPCDDTPLSLDCPGINSEPHALRSGYGPAVIVVTEQGKDLTGSPEHRVLTIDERTGTIAFIPLKAVTKGTHLIGVAKNQPLSALPAKGERQTHPEDWGTSLFLSLTYDEQALAVADRILSTKAYTGGHIALKESSHSFALCVATVVTLMGCHATVTRYQPLPDVRGVSTSFIHITPLSESSVLNQVLMRLCDNSQSPYPPQSFFDPSAARVCLGMMAGRHSELLESDMDEQVSTAIGTLYHQPSVIYSERVSTVTTINTDILLCDLCPTSRHTGWADGFIVSAAPAAN